MENWKEMLTEEMGKNGEKLKDIESNTMTQEQMVQPVYSDRGGISGVPFTVWTKKSVYFPICCSGRNWVGRVSRNPDGKPTQHQGSE